MKASTASTPKAIITGPGVLKKIRSDSFSCEQRQMNHTAPRPKNSHAPRFERGRAGAVEPTRELFQSSVAPSRARNRPGRSVARKRLMKRMATKRHKKAPKRKNSFCAFWVPGRLGVFHSGQRE